MGFSFRSQDVCHSKSFHISASMDYALTGSALMVFTLTNSAMRACLARSLNHTSRTNFKMKYLHDVGCRVDGSLSLTVYQWQKNGKVTGSDDSR